MADDRENPVRTRRKVPTYFITIVGFFVIPVIVAMKLLWGRIPKRPFFISVATISVIGWAWSWVVSSQHWWSFGENFMLGIEVIPHLPLEELLFYPLGGAFSLLAYIYVFRYRVRTSAPVYWTYLATGTVIFGTIAYLTRANGPYYLYSQLVVFNFACGLALAPFAAKRINLLGLLPPVLMLGTIGYVWDYAAFSFGWWDYHAITQIRVAIVPLDDFNFFFFAPPAAISIYVLVCSALKHPQSIEP